MKARWEQLEDLSRCPAFGTEAFELWVRQRDFLRFLEEDAKRDQFLLFAAAVPHLYVHGVVVPRSALVPLDVSGLLDWDCDPGASWGVAYCHGADRRISIDPPLAHSRCRTLAQGEKLVFLRSFEGRIEDPTYFDLLQKLTHAFDLHFVPERNAYCRFDERGDFDDVISIHISDTSHAKERRNLRVVQIDRRVLDEYLTITETAYIRLFDSTRYAAGQFSHWDQARERVEDSTAQLYYTFGKAGHDASYIRGFQVISSPLTADQVIKRMHGGDEDKQYETFLAHDFKHKRIAECSCDPRKLGSYFDESDLPFQMSPAFFSPDVLARYKADTDKYKLCDRSIICRGGWVLEHYDVNEAGQVHTYLKDLGGLPYEEQRYWKSRNERPKGPISERAYKSHFLGEWYEDDDPLRELRELLAQLAKARAPWWTLKSENLLEKAHYPVTEAADEWAREIGTLDKLLSEGLEVGELRRRAKGLGRTVDSTWRSLKLAEEVLLGLGHDAQEAKQALAPLREVCDLRSTTTGTHVTGEKAKAKKAAIVKEHGTFQAHYRSLCRRCVMSMLRLREVFSAE